MEAGKIHITIFSHQIALKLVLFVILQTVASVRLLFSSITVYFVLCRRVFGLHRE